MLYLRGQTESLSRRIVGMYDIGTVEVGRQHKLGAARGRTGEKGYVGDAMSVQELGRPESKLIAASTVGNQLVAKKRNERTVVTGRKETKVSLAEIAR